MCLPASLGTFENVAQDLYYGKVMSPSSCSQPRGHKSGASHHDHPGHPILPYMGWCSIWKRHCQSKESSRKPLSASSTSPASPCRSPGSDHGEHSEEVRNISEEKEWDPWIQALHGSTCQFYLVKGGRMNAGEYCSSVVAPLLLHGMGEMIPFCAELLNTQPSYSGCELGPGLVP